MPAQPRDILVEKLHLDVNNPRLPEGIQGHSEAEVLGYLYEKEELTELAVSMCDNGFFTHEPLLVWKAAAGGEDFTVLEGNRRLATLKILLADPIAEDIQFDGLTLTPERRGALQQVPCVEVAGRAEILSFLGFRHIEGPRPWSPEAKARYIVDAVDQTVQHGSPRPFHDVGRRIGSNTPGVRNLYVALKILRVARDEHGLDVNPVLDRRFGFWQRCMNSPEIRQFIGFESADDIHEIEASLKKLKREEFRQVLDDVRPGGRLTDSRDITEYGKVLVTPLAYERFRETDSLEEARRVLKADSLTARVTQLQHDCEKVGQEINGLEVIDDGLRQAVSRLQRVVKGMWAAVKED